MKQTFSVAVYPPGDSFNRVVITSLECEAHEVENSARGHAHAALTALAKVPPASWRTAIVSQTEVTDL